MRKIGTAPLASHVKSTVLLPFSLGLARFPPNSSQIPIFSSSTQNTIVPAPQFSMSVKASSPNSPSGSCSGSGPSVSRLRHFLSVLEAAEFEVFRLLDCALRFISATVSAFLTLLFVSGGVVAGAITGALAGRITDTGAPRGAGLGAVAGAVLSLEVLEASRAYWCLEQSGLRGSSTMADFMEELLQERFLSEEITPSMATAYPQVNVARQQRRNDRINDVYVHGPIQGLSGDFLKKLPCHVMGEMKGNPCICCTICLQNIQVGEVARCLPRCHHMFHLICVDKWLTRHRSCPVCRQDVLFANKMCKFV